MLKGRLPVLQRLKIDVRHMSHTIDFFEGAPRLETLIVRGMLLGKIGTIPYNQLTELACDHVQPAHLPRAISLASALPPGSHFNLLAAFNEENPGSECITPRVSAISRFSCRIRGILPPRIKCPGLGGIFASLSLPNLEELRLMSTEYPRIVLEWPHAQFLELSTRSGFHLSLKVLQIAEVVITHGELIVVLSALGSLEHLEVADKRPVDGEDRILLTDDFLRAITFQPPDASRQLIPRLRRFACATQLQFRNHVFVAFVASRLEVCSSNAFHVDIHFLDGCEGSASLLHDLREHSDSRLSVVAT
jgi:hypothetical protein